ncbi:MAG: cytochrome c biogenesis protein CcsA [Proteobacteria bacterium]|nr:cytochrome c biogenesis protein CcsA [Pseudomonadota bacterium]
MMENLIAIRFIVSGLYLCAAIAYVFLLRSGRKQAEVPTYLLGAGLAIHVGEIIVRGAESGALGGAPFVSLSGFISIFSLLLGLTYFVLERQYSRRYRIASLGAFHVPVLFTLHAWSAFLKQPLTEIPELNTGAVFVLHVVSAICAYAALTAGFVAGTAYLLLNRQLRKKNFGILFRGLPNLDLVERVNATAVKIGVSLLILGVIMGFLRGHLELGPAFKLDIKVWVTLLTIAIFGAQIILRRYAGWTGRRAVIISVIGFVVILINATIMNVFFSQLHGGK